MIQIDYADIKKDDTLLSKEKTKEFFIQGIEDMTGNKPERVVFLKDIKVNGQPVIHTDATSVTFDNVDIGELIAPSAEKIIVRDAFKMKSIKAPNAKTFALRNSRDMRHFSMPLLEWFNCHNAQFHGFEAPNLTGGKINACPYLTADKSSLKVVNNLVFSPAIDVNKTEKTTLAFYNLDKDVYAHGLVKNIGTAREFMDQVAPNVCDRAILIKFIEHIEESKADLFANRSQGLYTPASRLVSLDNN